MKTNRQRYHEAVFERHGQRCSYCGDTESRLTMDHLVPLNSGGACTVDNLVPACGVCNSIKSDRTVEQMRYRLIQKRIGWPKFNLEQLDWLRSRGFDMSEFDNTKLAFEDGEAA